MTLTIGSLFSGIGGLELGLEQHGMRTVWQVEKNPYCQTILAKHWPDAQRYPDVKDVGAHNLAPVDIICGGFPCQDISYAGKGEGLAGSRSSLWFEYARIIGELGPRYVVVENVPALLTRGIDAVLGTLADLGYDAEWQTISAADCRSAPPQKENIHCGLRHERQSRTSRRATWRADWATGRRTPMGASRHRRTNGRTGPRQRRATATRRDPETCRDRRRTQARA